MSAIAQYFKFAERGTNISTETRAGLTTFMVMAYIIFLNPSILMTGFSLPGVEADPRYTIVALAAGTALDRGHRHDRDGRDRQLPARPRRRPGHQRDRGVLAHRQGPVARGRDGRDPARGPRHPRARRGGLPRGRHERRAARAQEGDRCRHRPVHPVHRVRRRRCRGRQHARHPRDVPSPDDGRRLRVLDRPDPDGRAVGPPGEGGAGDQHPRDDAHRPRGRRPEASRDVRADAVVHDARRSRSAPDLREARATRSDPHDLLDHADRLLRHDGHRHRRRSRGRSRAGGRLRPGRRARAARRLGRGSDRRCRRRQLEHDLHRVRRGRRRGWPDGLRVGRDRRAVPARHPARPDRRDHPCGGDGPRARPRGLPDVHPGQGHRRHQRRGRHPRPARR